MPSHDRRHNKALGALDYVNRLLKGAITMRKSYKLYNHEYCKAHVDVYLDENNMPKGIQLWSYDTIVCGLTQTNDGEWIVFCTGTYSQTTRRQISWFSRQPWQSPRDWKLSYQFFKEISEKYSERMRKATNEEVYCICDLIWQYVNDGKESRYVYR